MCITRLGRVLVVDHNRAMVRFLDTDVTKDVDISMVEGLRKNSYVEVFGDLVLGQISPSKAKSRQKLVMEIRRKTINA